jgi:hypothetical protein
MHAMTSHDAIQSRRSELKFTIDESQTLSIRQYLGARLRPDPHGISGGYPVCSVYLDTPDSRLYLQTSQGVRNRYKLRVRIYDDQSGHPAYLEIKRRDGKAVRKQRARVDRTLAAALLSGRYASLTDSTVSSVAQPSHDDWVAFHEFCRLRDIIGAVGTTYVCYRREAYVSPLRSDWRATFDRNLVAGVYRPGSPLEIPEEVVKTDWHGKVVFELKFTNRFPNWMQDLVRTFNLTPGPFPKYLTCRDAIAPCQPNQNPYPPDQNSGSDSSMSRSSRARRPVTKTRGRS